MNFQHFIRFSRGRLRDEIMGGALGWRPMEGGLRWLRAAAMMDGMDGTTILHFLNTGWDE